MKIIEVAIKNLKPYAKNPRINDGAVEKVANSIQAFGFKIPMVIDAENNIVCGHTRLKAAERLGLKKVPCVVADDLTPEQIKAFRLADNKTAEFAEWDMDLLAEELSELAALDFDMGDFGFDVSLGRADESDMLQTREDDFDETTTDEPKAKIGDIYLLGNHRLMCGDATDAGNVAKLMDGQKADMIFTDPPYNVAIGSKNKALNTFRKGGITENIIGDVGMTDEEIGEKLWRPAFQNMRGNAKDDCAIYVTMPQGGSHMMMMMMSASWQVKHELIWLKNQPTFSMGRLDYDYQHEPICYGWAKTHKWYGKGQFDKSIWSIDKPQKSELHPTMKPLALIENALLNSSADGDNILDLFGGSGSTLIACEQLHRKCFMMELDPKYVDVIISRWENFTGKTAELAK